MDIGCITARGGLIDSMIRRVIDVCEILKALTGVVGLKILDLVRLWCEGRPEVGKRCHGVGVGLNGHHGIPAVRAEEGLAGKAVLSLKMRLLIVLRVARGVGLLEERGSAGAVANWHGVCAVHVDELLALEMALRVVRAMRNRHSLRVVDLDAVLLVAAIELVELLANEARLTVSAVASHLKTAEVGLTLDTVIGLHSARIESSE